MPRKGRDEAERSASLAIPAPPLWTPLGTALPASLPVDSPKTRPQPETPATAMEGMEGNMSGFTQSPCLIQAQQLTPRHKHNESPRKPKTAATGVHETNDTLVSDTSDNSTSSSLSEDTEASAVSTSSSSLMRPTGTTTLASELLYVGARVRLHPERCEEELYAIDRLGNGAVRAVRFIARHGLIGEVVRKGSTQGTLLVRFVLPPSLIAASVRAAQQNNNNHNNATKHHHHHHHHDGRSTTGSQTASTHSKDSHSHAAYVPLSRHLIHPTPTNNNNNSSTHDTSATTTGTTTTTTTTVAREHDGSQSEGPLIAFLSLTRSPKFGPQSRTLTSSATASNAFALLAGPHALWSLTPPTQHSTQTQVQRGGGRDKASGSEVPLVPSSRDEPRRTRSVPSLSVKEKSASAVKRRAHSWPLYAARMTTSLQLALASSTLTLHVPAAASSKEAALRPQSQQQPSHDNGMSDTAAVNAKGHANTHMIHHHHQHQHEHTEHALPAEEVKKNAANNIKDDYNTRHAHTFSLAFVIPAVCCVPLLSDVLAGGRGGHTKCSIEAIHAALEKDKPRRALRLVRRAVRLMRASRKHTLHEETKEEANNNNDGSSSLLTMKEKQRVNEEEDAVIGALRARLALTAGKLRRCMRYSLTNYACKDKKEVWHVAEYVVPLLTSLWLRHEWQLARRLVRHVLHTCEPVSLNFVRVARLVRVCEKYTAWQQQTTETSSNTSSSSSESSCLVQMMPRMENMSDALTAARLLATRIRPHSEVPAELHRGLRVMMSIIFSPTPPMPTAALLRAVPLLFALTNSDTTMTVTASQAMTRFFGAAPMCHLLRQLRFYATASVKSETVLFTEECPMAAILDVRLVDQGHATAQQQEHNNKTPTEHVHSVLYCAHCHRRVAEDTRTSTFVSCEECGAVYCGPACRLWAWRGYHAVECPGTSSNTSDDDSNDKNDKTQTACARRALRRMREGFQHYYTSIQRYAADHNNTDGEAHSNGFHRDVGCVTLPRNAQTMNALAMHVVGRIAARLICLVCMPAIEPLLSPNESNDDTSDKQRRLQEALDTIAAYDRITLRHAANDPHRLLWAEALMHALRLPFFADTSYAASATVHELLQTQPPVPSAEKNERPTTAKPTQKDTATTEEEVNDEVLLSSAEGRAWYAAHIILVLLRTLHSVIREELAGFKLTRSESNGEAELHDIVTDLTQLITREGKDGTREASKADAEAAHTTKQPLSISYARLLSFLDSNRFAQQLYDFCLCSFIAAQAPPITAANPTNTLNHSSSSHALPSSSSLQHQHSLQEQRLLVFLSPCASTVSDLSPCATRLAAPAPLLYSRFVLEHVAQDPQWGLSPVSNAGLRSAEDSFLSLNSGSAGTFTSQSSHTFVTATSNNNNNAVKSVGGVKELSSQGTASPMSAQVGPAAGAANVSAVEPAGHTIPLLMPNVRIRLYVQSSNATSEASCRVAAVASRTVMPGEVICAEDMAQFAESS